MPLKNKPKDEQLDDIEKDIKKYAKLDIVANSEGGKELVKNLGSYIVSTINQLCHKYKSASHIELISLIAQLDSKINLYQTLMRAKGQKMGAKKEYEKRLEELLK